MNLSTNRGNYLLLNMLKYRFPNVFGNETIKHVTNLLAKSLDTWGNCIFKNDKVFL